MLPIERQDRITELILKRENMRISELSSLFDVSEMTIHRDLKPLIEKGIILKTFGGITLKKQQKSYANNNICVFCSRNVSERTAYRLILSDHTMEIACCAHCGLLRHHQLNDEEIQAVCHDFFNQTTINALLTFYVMDTSIDIRCCQPQVLTFEKKDHAEKFVKGFGGAIYHFNDAMEVILQKMKGINYL